MKDKILFILSLLFGYYLLIPGIIVLQLYARAGRPTIPYAKNHGIIYDH